MYCIINHDTDSFHSGDSKLSVIKFTICKTNSSYLLSIYKDYYLNTPFTYLFSDKVSASSNISSQVLPSL